MDIQYLCVGMYQQTCATVPPVQLPPGRTQGKDAPFDSKLFLILKLLVVFMGRVGVEELVSVEDSPPLAIFATRFG